jgi:hypothetical protein
MKFKFFAFIFVENFDFFCILHMSWLIKNLRNFWLEVNILIAKHFLLFTHCKVWTRSLLFKKCIQSLLICQSFFFFEALLINSLFQMKYIFVKDKLDRPVLIWKLDVGQVCFLKQLSVLLLILDSGDFWALQLHCLIYLELLNCISSLEVPCLSFVVFCLLICLVQKKVVIAEVWNSLI